MVARIVLTVDEGRDKGRRFEFDEPTRCVVGRARDCGLKLPGEWEYQLVSRHHCELDIDPPFVRVHDLGSRNGTYVNGRLIGRRPVAEMPEAPPQDGAEYDLLDGDELGVGPITFRVAVADREEVPTNPGCIHCMAP